MQRLPQKRKQATDQTCEIARIYQFLLVNAKTAKLRKKILATGIEHMAARKAQLKGVLDHCGEEAIDSFTAELKKIDKAL